MDWQSPISIIPMIGPIYAKRLANLDIITAIDLLLHLPSRYEDYTLISKIGAAQGGERVTIVGTVNEIKNVYTRNRKQIQTASVRDDTGTILATWFNQPFITNSLKPGSPVSLSGNVKMYGNNLQLESPEYEVVRVGKPLLHSGRLVPVYPETAGVSSKWLRSRIYPLLTSAWIREYLPENILKAYNLLDIREALKSAHFPQSLEEAVRAKTRLAFDELFLIQIGAFLRRRQWHADEIQQPLSIDEEKIGNFIASLPFQLTESQKKSLRQILSDMGKSTPMNRLLEGDVGSGKTVVAAIAIYVAYINNLHSLFMAPTEILAEQHFKTLTQLLSPYQINVGLITSSHKLNHNNKELSTKNLEQDAGPSSQFDVLVGTHALLEKNVKLDRIGLIVIDEQHRFGVRQRALLRKKGETPHVLTMTATPIPRTIALTLYGDLDLSIINELPQGRKRIKTWVVPPEKRSSAYNWIRTQVKISGTRQQAFIVCPFIEQSETLSSVKAASAEFDYLSTQIFSDLRLGLLHGRMKPLEKQALLQKFRDGSIDILVTTPVIEVGIDIPEAVVILIEAAERFGLAQLHQLRGRVGRSDQQSYCLLFTTATTSQSVSRLKNLEKAFSGPELAELDLKIRGPGQVYGLAQHGRDRLKIASYSDLEMIESARSEAKKVVDYDPTCTTHPLLKERLVSSTILEIAPD